MAVSSNKYFDNFPKVNYSSSSGSSGTTTTARAVDITARASLLKSVYSNPYLYYPYDLSNGIRADQISDDYYDDQYLSWLIYLSNGIIDPYYQWYLQYDDFNSMLLAKYNVDSIDDLKQIVDHYAVNWWSDERLSVETYNALPSKEIRYWEPVYNNNIQPVYYKRRQLEWTVTTNQLVKLNVTNVPENIISGEKTTIDLNPVKLNVGRGQLISSGENYVIIEHTSGNTIPATDFDITSETTLNFVQSKNKVKITGGMLLQRNIPLNESKYWVPITIYDKENAINEYNKTIRVIDKQYSTTAAKQLNNVLKG